MIEYRVTLEVKDSLHVGSGPEVAFFTEGLPYLPGTTLRGALARLWILDNGYPNDPELAPDRRQEFEATFEGSIRFGPCVVAGTRLEGLSERYLKYRDEDFEGEQPSVVDLALGQDSPHQGYEAGKGRYRGVALRDAVNTAIDPVTGGAKKEQLFGYTFLPRGTRLYGSIVAAQDDAWLESLTEGPSIVRMGGRRSVSGRVAVSLERAEPASVDAAVHAAADHERIVVRTLSPTLFVDDATRPVIGFPDADLARAMGVDASEVVVVEQYVRPLRLHGWHAAAGLPKPDELALVQGSTVVVDLRHDDAEQRREALSRLLWRGLGLRRSEGFGFVELVTECRQLAAATEEEAPPIPTGLAVPYESLSQDGLSNEPWLPNLMKGLAGMSNAQREGLDVLQTFRGRGDRRRLSESQARAIEELNECDAETLVDLAYVFQAQQGHDFDLSRKMS